KTSKSTTLMSEPLPTHRDTFPPLRWPAFSTPRSASEYSLLPLNAASDSSSNKVGRQAANLRTRAAAEVLAVIHGRSTTNESNSRSQLFPLRFSALVTCRYGAHSNC